MHKLIILSLMIITFSALSAEDESKVEFSNESEFALFQSGGNSVVETYNLNTLSKWKKVKRIYSFGGHYTLGFFEQNNKDGSTTKIESTRNWDVEVKYEQELSKVFSAYSGISYEGDKFTGIKQRENLDLGGKYFLIKDDKTVSFTELGLRYTVEKRLQRNEENEDVFNFTKSKVLFEISHIYSNDLSFKYWVEYLPNFTESKDYLVTYDVSMSVILTKLFSLKSAFRSIYYNKPAIPGNKNRDHTLTTSLLAKF